jgi:hypothetical protein
MLSSTSISNDFLPHQSFSKETPTTFLTPRPILHRGACGSPYNAEHYHWEKQKAKKSEFFFFLMD